MEKNKVRQETDVTAETAEMGKEIKENHGERERKR